MGKVSPDRIQRFRTEFGYTQEDLAELCGVDASCISRWETGKWSPSTANSVRLAKALKVSVEDLYDDGEASIEDVATKPGGSRVSRIEATGTGSCPHTYSRAEKITGKGLIT